MKGTPAKRLLYRKSTLPATAPQTVAEVLSKHVVLEVESIDRMYLNVIVGRLQILEGALRFIRQQRQAQVLSPNAVEPMTRAFVQAIEQFVRENRIPLMVFEKRQRKDDVAAQLRARYPHRRRRHFRRQSPGEMHCVPHVAYPALDNGIRSCANPKRLQAICDSLSSDRIDTLLRKWFRRLPHPFPARDRQAGYRYPISILQIQLSLAQVLDRPVSGRIFFEDVIRKIWIWADLNRYN